MLCKIITYFIKWSLGVLPLIDHRRKKQKVRKPRIKWNFWKEVYAVGSTVSPPKYNDLNKNKLLQKTKTIIKHMEAENNDI